MYLVNKSSKREPVKRVYKIREKSQSLLDHPRRQTAWFFNPFIDSYAALLGCMAMVQV